jgi:RHS repeat-associated protein
VPSGAQAGTYRFVTDQVGSVRLVVDTVAGTVVERVDYDEFGNVVADSGTVGMTPFGYAGGLRDKDTGLTRLGARDYDPGVGRWTNEDPLRFDGDSSNLYAYVGANPISFNDVDGRSAAPVLVPSPPPAAPPPLYLVRPLPPPTPWWTPVGSALGGALTATSVAVTTFLVVFLYPKKMGNGELPVITSGPRSRGQQDPPWTGSYKPTNPGRGPNGDCNPCPPDSPIWTHQGDAHGSTCGSHDHQIKYNQDPKTCICYPERVELQSP